MEDKKERLDELLEQKNTIAKFWLGGMLVSITLAIAYGLTKDPEYIGMAFAGFVISTVGATMFLSSVENEQEELEEELRVEKLEKRIEKLEDEVE